MYISNRSNEADIRAALTAQLETSKKTLTIMQCVKNAAMSYSRKNFDRNFIRHADPLMPYGVRITMQDGNAWEKASYNVCLYGGELRYDSRETLYSVDTIEKLREDAAARCAGIEKTIASLSSDLQNLRAILQAYDKAEKAMRELDDLASAAWCYRDKLPLMNIR